MKNVLFSLGWLLLLITEMGRVYFIMPFPGSQQSNTIELAYWIHTHLGVLRLFGALLIGWPLFVYYKEGSKRTKIAVGSLLLLYAVVFYLFNFRLLAEKMFYQPSRKVMASVLENKVPLRQLVIGLSMGDDARAYPIEIIGYHHQVRDSIGRYPTMVTYCTVCRTGRVFSPRVGSELETFRLVGMDHFNAMFEDSKTGSWWRQASGESIAGPLKGWKLTEFNSHQMSLESWIKMHPNTLILQPDEKFKEGYDDLKDFDEGKGKGKLTGTDTASWHDKSWVIGISQGLFACAYDWNDLKLHRVLNDRLVGKPLVIALESDTVSFHVWSSIVERDTLNFSLSDSAGFLMDNKYHSRWDEEGLCVAGKWKGQRMIDVQAYQEFWHSWMTFHPQTTRYDYQKANSGGMR